MEDRLAPCTKVTAWAVYPKSTEHAATTTIAVSMLRTSLVYQNRPSSGQLWCAELLNLGLLPDGERSDFDDAILRRIVQHGLTGTVEDEDLVSHLRVCEERLVRE